MPKKKRNKRQPKAAGQRRQEKAQEPVSSTAAEAPETQEPEGPQAAAPPEPKIPTTVKPPRRRDMGPRQAVPKTLVFQEAQGQDGAMNVAFPARMDVQSLLKAIRSEQACLSGTVYITLGQGGKGGSLSYEYDKGLYTRREPLSGKRSDRQAPLLADILEVPVKKITASGTGGRMSWHVEAYTASMLAEAAQ